MASGVDSISERGAELSAAQRELLERRLRGAAADGPGPATTIPRRPPGERVQLSFAQKGVWFLDQLAPGVPLYNIPVAFRVRGRLRADVLREALTTIVARHESLRTRFTAEDGTPWQRPMPPEPVEVPVIDLTHLAGDAQEEALRRCIATEAERPFDLGRDLLVRAALVRLAGADHVLALTLHHIAADAWSLGVMFHELEVLYGRGLSAMEEGGAAEPLPELPIQYADFAVWQRERLEDSDTAELSAFWRGQLEGAPDSIPLPLDRPRSSSPTWQGGVERLALPEDLVQRLRATARRESVTLFMLLLGAFKVLLQRHSGATDIVVGTPIGGRTDLATEKLIGFFVNTLVLRTDLDGDPSFTEVLRRVRQTAVDAYAHQELPFEKIVEALKLERTSSHPPLLQVMFTLQGAAARTLKLAGLEVEPLPVSSGTSKFDLTLLVEDNTEGMELFLEYSLDLFEPGTAARLLMHLRNLLEGITSDPAQRISELPLLSTSESHQLLFEWNDTRREYPREASVALSFEEQARRTPGAVAVSAGPIRLTYRELNDQANRLAGYLQRQGVGRGSLVAISLDRSPRLIIGLLAILKAGAGYVALDPAYPPARLAYMLKDCGASALVTERRLTERFGPALPQLRTVWLDAESDRIAGEDGQNREHGVGGDDVAYVCYTSGSTGQPKGVCIPHRAIHRLVLNTDYVQLGESDVVAQISNCAFDASTFEIWGALLRGARLAIFPPEVVLSPTLLAKTIEVEGVTALFVTTALFNQVARDCPQAFRGVHHVLFGGEASNPACVNEVLAKGPPGRLLHVYGPTETTTFATWHLVTEIPAGATSIPIGRPIANTRLYVLDGHQQPVPIGVPGELYIGGDGVGLGYLNQPQLTAERFVPDPFSGTDGALLYRTGDVVRYRKDGAIEFLHRLDGQVKIRGFRVEPGEIESALMSHPAVSQCAVVPWSRADEELRLAAYVVSQAGGGVGVDSGALRRFLENSLPAYMVPAVIRFVHSLPLTPNGKIDRRALPAPEGDQPAGDECAVRARDQTEARLVAIWEDLLGIRPVGVTSSFFELGGHSLAAVRMVARIEKDFRKRIPVAAVFQSPTIAQLATILRQGSEPTDNACIVEIQSRGRRPALFLVHGVGGGMFWGYANLSRYLGPDQPVYAFKSRGTDGDDEFKSIEEMAAHYVAELRRFQPHGPYYLGGYCFGGNVAYEMARQLHAGGERVALLALINSVPPNASYQRLRFTPASCLRLAKNLVDAVGHFASLTRAQQRQVFGWKLRALVRKFGRRLGGHADTSVVDVDEFVDLTAQPADRRGLWEAHVRALFQHVPKRFDGSLTLLRSQGHAVFCSYDDAYGWRELADGGVAVRVVPGAHESVLDEPHVRALADELELALLQTHERELELRCCDVVGPRVSTVPAGYGHDPQALSPVQERHWFIDRLESDKAVQQLAFGIRFHGTVQVEVLQSVLDELVRRHEPLRTHFVARDGRPAGRVGEPVSMPFRRASIKADGWTDLNHVPDMVREEASARFDLSCSPLIRACLYESPGEPGGTLVLAAHSIAVDRTSAEFLMDELLALYREGVEPNPPEPARALGKRQSQYSDFARWQQGYLEGQSVGPLLEYWKKEMEGAPALLELPTDFPRPAVQSHRAARQLVKIKRSTANTLRAISRAEGCSVGVTLLGAFQTLIWRHVETSDIVVGMPVSGRMVEGTERLIGPFEDLTLVRMDFSDDPGFRILLRRVAAKYRDAIKHQVPFETLVNELRPARDRSCHPLFQAMFVHRAMPRRADAAGGLCWRRFEVDLGSTDFDLALRLNEDDQEISGYLEFALDLFEPLTMLRLADRFSTLLDSIAAEPDSRLSALRLRTLEERQWLADWNDTAARFPRERCIHHLFEEQARRTPEISAVAFQGHSLSYRELDQLADEIACELQALGVGADSAVGICLERSIAMAASVLGVLKAGGACVPLDPAYPVERLRLMVDNARLPVLITHAQLQERLGLSRPGLAWLCIDAHGHFERSVSESRPDRPTVRSGAENLAYIIHTSGSTGTPKGVAMPHSVLVNLMTWQCRHSRMGRESRTLQFSSLSFDVSFQEMFSTWCCGGTLVLIEEELRRDPAALLRFLTDEGIERLFLPFVALQQLAESFRDEMPLPTRLREVITAGEQLQITPKIVRMFELLPHCTLHNHYGPSESHVVTAYSLKGPPNRWPALPPIGRPIANARIHLLDAQNRQVPVGVAGELYIGGDCLARGYIHRPDLTAERFVPDPFSREPGARLYRTGDRARWRFDGNIEFLGRIDHQVKIRGYRIELDEVEAVLGRHPNVRECAVAVRDGTAGEKRLVAWVVPGEGEPVVTENELRAFLREKLPDYMVPSAFQMLAALPLTPSGKVNRKALPAPKMATRAAPAQDETATPVEATLARIWARVLGLDHVGLDDNFFELGGHSLLAVRIVEQTGEAFGRRLPVAAVFEAPTIRRLASVLHPETIVTGPASSIIEIQPKGSQPPLFFVHGAGGGMLWGYSNLARHLGTDQPVYAFNSRALSGLEEFTTIEEMAAKYVADLLKFRPEGGYRLGGYCFGGNVAYEMARQLEAAGHRVELLALFNSWPANSSYHKVRLTPRFCLRFAQNLRYWAGYVVRLPDEQRRELITWKARALQRRVARVCQRVWAGFPDINVEEWVDLSAQPEDRHRLWETHIRAFVQHRTGRYGGDLTLFRTRGHPILCSFDDACGWGELVEGRVSVHLVPGAHENVLEEPHVRTSASMLARCLSEPTVNPSLTIK